MQIIPASRSEETRYKKSALNGAEFKIHFGYM